MSQLPRKNRAKDPTSSYARGVVEGKVVAGPLVRLACQRHLDDVEHHKRKRLEWKVDLANLAIDFFPANLCFEDGQAFTLEPFQEFIVGSLFGWYTEGGYRRFRTAYVEQGKGNGKSPLAAGIGLLGLIFDGLSSAEIYSAAVTQDQAGIIFKDAKRMVESSADLRAEVEVLTNNLRAHETNAIFRAVSAEHKSLDGKRVHMGLIDELHEHPHGLVVQKIRAGTKRDRNALIFEITNAGHDKTSVCWHHHDYSEKILTGIEKNDAWFAYVCELDKEDDWKDPKVWPKANPGLGTILPIEYLEEQVKEARGMPSSENLVRRLNFCEWLEGATKWLDMEAWGRCGTPRPLSSLAGRECYIGLDLATTTDFAAEALLFPDDGETFDLHVRFWLPEEAKKSQRRTERDRRNLIDWGAQGFITFTPGNVTDYDFIETQVKRDLATFRVRALPFDRWNSTQLITHLKNEGAPVVEFGQGFASMSAPTKQFERLVKSGAIRHGGNPVLRWMAANTCVRLDPAENLKPDKEASAERIDGIVASIMALGAWMNQEREETNESVYDRENRSIEVF